MDLDRAGVDQQRRAVRCVPHGRPQGGPYAPIAPPAAAAGGMLPVAGVGGQVAPRRPGAQNPKPGMQKPPVVRGEATHLARTSGQQGFPTWPDAVRDVGAPVCGGPARLLPLCVSPQCTRKSLV